MIYIPKERMIPVVPDMNDLPSTVRLPRDKRWPFAVVVASGIWMIFGAFSGLWMPLFWPQSSLSQQVAIAFVLTLSAILGGIFALRHYAREDEVTIGPHGIKYRIFGWFSSRETRHQWSDITGIVQSESGNYQVLEAVLNVAEQQTIPVLISKSLSETSRVKDRLEGILRKGE